MFYKSGFKCHPVGSFNSLEVLSCLITGPPPLLCILIYRPLKSVNFIPEFSELLYIVLPRYDRVVILGDFNIHVCCPSQSLTSHFLDLIDSFNLTQYVKEPTHSKGHTLDLALSSGLSFECPSVLDMPVTDHKAVTFKVPFQIRIPTPYITITSRILNAGSAANFCDAFNSSSFNLFLSLLAPNALLNSFNGKCLSILDHIAPFKTRTQKPNNLPWFNDHTRALRRLCRKSERQWRANKLESTHITLKNLTSTYQDAVKDARSAYFSDLSSRNNHNPKALFVVINSVIRDTSTSSPEPDVELSNRFLTHFISKVENIRSQIQPASHILSIQHHNPASFTQFQPVSMVELENTVFST